jgi:hypothetical protein
MHLVRTDCYFGFHAGKSQATLTSSRWFLSKLGSKGVTGADAILFAQALEAKLMDKHKNKYATIMDPFLIVLDELCDANKQPNVNLSAPKIWTIVFGCAVGL